MIHFVSAKWSKDFVSEFIDAFRGILCLWKVKSKSYHHSCEMKDTANAPLLEKVKTIDPDATRDTIKKEKLRSSFCKEHEKVQQCKKSWNEHTICTRAKIMVLPGPTISRGPGRGIPRTLKS
ncbi:hypothetical protein PR048_019254 [Dryococelus australis]|uniref:Uncharacterized protein n=1 Tax=Dryococelus australis TaxID=614101 RepID=A0ABQ9H2Y7_9NEOP|nr:hypothetical protein PR048_019254 [Dryococelus australis]